MEQIHLHEATRPSAPARGHLGQQRNDLSFAQSQHSSREPRTQAQPASAVSNVEFIALAFCRVGPADTPWVTGFSGDPGAVHHATWGGGPAIPLPRFIDDRNNNYVAVSSFGRGTDGRHHRRKDCFSAMHMVMVDDVGTKVDFDKLALQPTCLVETSPGNFQGWYFLVEPERDRIRAETLIKGMIAGGLTADGSDPGMNGVTRYGRLPVGVNGKAKYVERLGHPFVQKVASWSTSARYSIEQIAHAYGVDMSVAKSPPRKRLSPARRPSHPGVACGDDAIIRILKAAALYVEPLSSLEGGHRIVCPWVHEHTDADPTGTVYFEPSDDNAGRGGFKCHHGHCQKRTIADLNHFAIRLHQSHTEVSLCKTI